MLSGDGRQKVVPNFAQGLKDMEKTLEKDMEGLKVKYTIPTKEGEPPHKRQFRVNGGQQGDHPSVESTYTRL